jgi:hypothetical protein
MDNQEEKIGKELTLEEEKELRDGSALLEMEQSNPGWQIVKEILESVGFHSWVDPRGMKKEDWEFAELNAFHAANNAKELLENIQKMISRSDYLSKIKSGEIDTRKFKI